MVKKLKDNPFFVLFLIFLSPILLLAQEGKKIYLEADMQYYDAEYLPGVDRFIGNVVFKHENSIGYCDSAYSYTSDNYIIAFGNPVKIFSGDSVELYGQRVYYDGETKESIVVRNVKLTNKTAALYTDTLIYDNQRSVGYFLEGGKLVDKDNTLTSYRGSYFTNTDFAFFQDSVKLVNDTYTMTCDSLEFDTKNEIANFISRTKLVSDENSIYTSSGWYDTKHNQALLIEDVILNSKEQQLFADTVYYDKNISEGIAYENITIIDTTQGAIVKGHYAEYREKGGISLVTDSALFIFVDQQDSLFLHSDTLKLLLDTLQNPMEVYAYHHVKFFNKDLQGCCDSMTYHVEDSLLTMYYNPVIWSEENQMSADTMRVFILDSVTATINLYQSSFITSNVFDEVDFNQIKGINVVGYIIDKKLRKVDVLNNAESIYYVLDEDTALIGVNISAATELSLRMANSELDKIIYYDNPEGIMYPDDQLPSDKRILKGFRWLNVYRPKEKKDIFHTPIPREKEVDNKIIYNEEN